MIGEKRGESSGKVLFFTRDPRPEYKRLEEILLSRGCEITHVVTTNYTYNAFRAEGREIDYLFNYFTQDRQQRIYEWFERTRDIDINVLNYKGYSLREILEYEIAVLEKLQDIRPLTWWYPIDFKAVDNVLDELRFYVALLIDIVEEILMREQPDRVVMWNGYPAKRRVITEVAQRLGIGCLYLERGFFRNTLQIDPEGVNVLSTLGRDTDPGPQISEEQRQALNSFLEDFTSRGESVVSQHDNLSPEQWRDRLGIDSNTKVIFLPLQVYHDTNLLLFSRFSSNEELLSALMEGVMDIEDVFIVAKTHPESDAKEAQRLQEIMGHRGRVIGDGNIHSLIRLSDVIAVNNSTVGLEALAYFKPVLAFGESVYSNKGIVFKVNETGDVPVLLRKALSLNGMLQGEMRNKAESFLYRVVFDYLTPPLDRRDRESEDRIFSKFFPEVKMSKPMSPSEKGKSPLVSVIIPTYNRPEMLINAINSVLSQSFRDFEIIVVNDAGECVEEIINKLNHENNIVYVRHSRNRGLAAARNTGIRLARGKYIAYLDDDDLYYPDHIETLVKALENSEYKVAYTDAYRATQVKEDGEYKVVERDVPYSYDFDYGQILVTNFIPVVCFMHEKSCLDEVGMFDESLSVLEDWDLWIRMSRKYKLLHIKKVTAEFTWRKDGSTMTSKRQIEFVNTGQIIQKRYREYAKDKPHILVTQQEAYRRDREKIYNMSDHPLVSVIIPILNNTEQALQCLGSVALNTSYEPYEVIIITRDSKALKGYIQGDVKVIQVEEDCGFIRACNKGAVEASGKYLVFLSENLSPAKGWLSELVKTAECNDGVGIVGSRLLYPDNTVWHAGIVLREGYEPYYIFRGVNADNQAVSSIREFEAVSMACMLVSRKLFFEIGGFKDKGENNEDTEFCLRVGEKGYRIIYNPLSTLYFTDLDSPQSEGEGAQVYDDRLLQSKIREAKDFISEGRIAEAISVFAKLLEFYPHLNELYAILCDLYIKIGWECIPKEWIKRAVKYDRSFIQTFNNLAGRLFSEEKFIEYHEIMCALSEAGREMKSFQGQDNKAREHRDRKTGDKDWGLHSGERQTASTLEGIRQDHINRYKYIADFIKHHHQGTGEIRILDFFCGNGYGSYLLAKEIESVRIDAVDGSIEAIEFAKEHFGSDKIRFQRYVFPSDQIDIRTEYDYIVAIESIEHVKDDASFIDFLLSRLKKGGFLFLSFPNKHRLDLRKNPNPHHFRHYDVQDIIRLLGNGTSNMEVIEIHGQDVYSIDEDGIIRGLKYDGDMALLRDYEGQFLMLTLKKV